MKLPLVCAALALATGCASSDDRKDNDVTLASAEPHFAAHEGRPTEHRVGHSKSGSTDDDDDPWWSSILGDFFGGFLGVLFSKQSDDPVPESRPRDPYQPW